MSCSLMIEHLALIYERIPAEHSMSEILPLDHGGMCLRWMKSWNGRQMEIEIYPDGRLEYFVQAVNQPTCDQTTLTSIHAIIDDIKDFISGRGIYYSKDDEG